MKQKLKIICLRICKIFFLFRLSQYVTRDKLRIICLHGFATNDACTWRGGIMMHTDVLNDRLKYLKESCFNVVTLDDGIERLYSGTLRPNSVVITVDDGFYNTSTLAHPIFSKYNFPYTVYLTTYYAGKNIAVVNLLLQYSFWKTTNSCVVIEDINKSYDLSTYKHRFDAYQDAFEYIDAIKGIENKKTALRAILNKLNLNQDELIEDTTFKLMTTQQVKELSDEGVDFQLHTHNHIFPNDEERITESLNKNSQWISDVTGTTPLHLCYPSGEYHENLFPLLERLGIKSATTVQNGLNSQTTNKFLLKRFLDDNKVPQIVYEAHMCGFVYLLNRLRAKLALRSRSRSSDRG